MVRRLVQAQYPCSARGAAEVGESVPPSLAEFRSQKALLLLSPKACFRLDPQHRRWLDYALVALDVVQPHLEGAPPMNGKPRRRRGEWQSPLPLWQSLLP